MTLYELERAYILYTLEDNYGHRENTAEALGISVRGLRNKLNQYKEDKEIMNNIPTEEGLRKLLQGGAHLAVQGILDTCPQLKYRLEQDAAGNWQLLDSVTGAALWLKKFITSDDELNVLKADVTKLSKVEDEVLITGETGTGKELIARALQGDREGNFVRINCAAMPEHLLESELFGHKKGAFTDASRDKEGLIMSASKGVMFLDEIGDMPLTLQAKMLNVLQPIDGKRYLRPVGSNEEKEISCRFVFATHRDLKSMMKEHIFRHDLYARISTFELYIKPLRERKEDIEPICREIGRLLNINDGIVIKFLHLYKDEMFNEKVDLSLNVRSLERNLKRFNILGKL